MISDDSVQILTYLVYTAAGLGAGVVTGLAGLSAAVVITPNQKEQFRISKERISKYFKPGTPARTMEDTIIKALDYYRKRQREIER